MMISDFTPLVSATALLLLSFSPFIQADAVSVEPIDLAKHLSTTIAPIPLHREPPKYPISAAKAGKEGWARLSLVIEADGRVSNVLVTEVVGSEAFASEAVKAVMKWEYEPAYENGKPVQRCDNTVQLDFRMSNSKGVSRKFKRWYGKTKEALGNNDYASAKLLLDEFEALGARNITENNNYEILAADYAKALNNKESELAHLNRISLSSNVFNEQQIFSILNNRFVLEVELNQYLDAKKTYKRISKLSAAEPYLSSYTQTIQQIDEFIASEQNIVVSADIKNNKFWHYGLLRNDFSLMNINGNLTKLDIRCANKFYTYTVEENNTWNIPAQWNNCSVYVFGEDNATFTLIEHPIKS